MWIHDKGATNLVCAIIKMAADDYAANYRRASRGAVNGKAKGPKPVEQVEELRRFFRSRWFGVLCDLDGEEIMRRCEGRKKGKRPAGGPDRPYHRGTVAQWERVAQWPELHMLLKEHRIEQAEMALEMGILPSSLVRIMRTGTEKTKARMVEAAHRIIERRKQHGIRKERR